MCSRLWQLLRGHLSLVFKCGSVFCLFLVSILIVACGANNTAQVPGSPPVTVTINLNQNFASPTPTLPPYSCGAWATQSTPGYYPGAVVDVYAKYVRNVDGNPVGMDQAQANATVSWPGGGNTVIPEKTTQDGLAVFPVPLQQSAVGHVVLVSVTFTSADGQHTCTVQGSQDAFFTAVIASPTASPSPTGTQGGPPGWPGGSPTGTSTASPPPGPPWRTRTPSPTP